MPVYKDGDRETWYVKFNYKDWTGEVKQKMQRGFKKQKEAKEFERDFLARAQASPDMRFSTLYELYMEDAKSRLKPTTYANKEFLLRLKVLPYFCNMPINTIEPSTVRRWQNALLNNKNNYSMTYMKTINNQLSAIFNFAMKYYKLQSNPARITGSIGRKNANSMNFWTVEEFEQFIEYPDKPTYTVVFNLLFWTGMRIGECLALTLNDFDFDRLTVSISKNYARHEGEDLILDPKTPKSKRTITLPEFLCEIVKDYASRIYDFEPSDRLFQITRSAINTHMTQICLKAGVKKIRVHDLRHSHASMLIEMNFSPLLIAERLGHEKVETTLQTYSHLYPNKQGEISAKLQSMHDMKSKKEIETSDNCDKSNVYQKCITTKK